jgi:hypothetical protein
MGFSPGSGVAAQRRALPAAPLLGFLSRRNHIEFGIDTPSATGWASCVDFLGDALACVADVPAAVVAGGRFVKIAMATSLSFAE